jgi:hypothetical protein
MISVAFLLLCWVSLYCDCYYAEFHDDQISVRHFHFSPTAQISSLKSQGVITLGLLGPLMHSKLVFSLSASLT